MSLENRLSIRPDGVVSKKAMGSRRMFTSSRLWISLEANMPPRARANDANSTRMACPIPNAAYTPKYPPLQRKDIVILHKQTKHYRYVSYPKSYDIFLGS